VDCSTTHWVLETTFQNKSYLAELQLFLFEIYNNFVAGVTLLHTYPCDVIGGRSGARQARLGLGAAGRGSELLPAPAMLLLLLAYLTPPGTNAPTIWHLLVRALPWREGSIWLSTFTSYGIICYN